jgi:hypothetical protein
MARNEAKMAHHFTSDSLANVIMERNASKLERCLKEGAYPNAVTRLPATSLPCRPRLKGSERIESTPLITALCQGKGWADAVQVLLNCGSDSHGQDGTGVSAHSYALGTTDP